MSREGGVGRADTTWPADDAERAFAELEVDRALDVYRGRLSVADLEIMRARLLEGLSEDPAVRTLLRASLPREVDQSGDVYYSPIGKKPG